MKQLIIAAIFLPLFASAQQVVDLSKDNPNGTRLLHAISGEAFVNTKFVNLVEGSPYFRDQWMNGRLVDKDGQEYKDLKIKIDLSDGAIHYLDASGTTFVATTAIREIILSDSTAYNYRFIHASVMPPGMNPPHSSWYLWLLTGNASLYKTFVKKTTEIKPYASATTEQRIRTQERYLIHYNNAFFEIKKPKDLPSILANKKTELEAWLTKQDDKKASIEDRLTAGIEYYNTLFTEKDK